MLNRHLHVIYKLFVYITMVLGVYSNADAQGVMAQEWGRYFRVVADTRGLTEAYNYVCSFEIVCRDTYGTLLTLPVKSGYFAVGGKFEFFLDRPTSCIEFLRFGGSSLDPLTGRSEGFAQTWRGPVMPIR